MNFGIRLLYTTACSLFVCVQLHALAVLVTSENDSGPGTLRQAIITINGGGTASNTITFAPNVTTISPLTPLPAIENTVTMDGLPAGVDCTQLSPVDNPEAFSAAITVTIDGSKMASGSESPIAGLRINANNVTIRGIRVANISGEIDTAFGIVVTSGSNVRIECCEVHDIHGLSDKDTGVVFTHNAVGIQGQDSNTIISHCFVHTIETGSLQPEQGMLSLIQIGSALGINRFAQIIECRIECIQTGSIIYTEGSGTPTLNMGPPIGITSITLKQSIGITDVPDRPLQQAKQCEECEGLGCKIITNSIINCCQAGSICATADATIDLISETTIAGINIEGNTIVISGTTICNITSSTVTLTDGTFSLAGNGVSGIFAPADHACLDNNTICSVQRGALTLGGINSNALLTGSYGIFVGGDEQGSAVLENNTVSTISCNTVTAQGICSRIEEFGDLDQATTPECVGTLIDPHIYTNPVCTGIFNTAKRTVTLRNNTIRNIAAGKRISQGTQSLIISKHATGITAKSLGQISAESNHVEDVRGAQLIAKPESAGIVGGNGCKGISLWHLETVFGYNITAKANTIRHICENNVYASPGTIGCYNFPIFDKETTQSLLPIAQTSGISITTNVPFNILKNVSIRNATVSGTIIAEYNTVDAITGGAVQGGIPGFGTIATGISVAPSINSQMLFGSDHTDDLQQACLIAQHIPSISYIRHNNIHNVSSGTNNSAYGILLDNSTNFVRSLDIVNSPIILPLTIANNTISKVTGFGVPTPFNGPFIASSGCGTTSQNSVTFAPFPFEPTSGIYTIFANCNNITDNTITHIIHPDQRARGITTQASNDMNITANTISTIRGYGIFVAGASAAVDVIDSLFGIHPDLFDNLFASARNKIYSNSTFNNTKQGIELGVINWNNYLITSLLQCGSDDDFTNDYNDNCLDLTSDTTVIVGNHGQPAPRICNVQINRDGTITIEFTLDSPEHPLTKFIIQFFANDTNSIPHGKRPLSAFDNPTCIFKTDFNGHAKTSITFTPIALAHCTDLFSAHVTVATTGQSTTVANTYKGDTSPFGLESKVQACPAILQNNSSTNNQKPWWTAIANNKS